MTMLMLTDEGVCEIKEITISQRMMWPSRFPWRKIVQYTTGLVDAPRDVIRVKHYYHFNKHTGTLHFLRNDDPHPNVEYPGVEFVREWYWATREEPFWHCFRMVDNQLVMVEHEQSRRLRRNGIQRPDPCIDGMMALFIQDEGEPSSEEKDEDE